MRSDKGPWQAYEVDWPKGIKVKENRVSVELLQNSQSISSNSGLMDESGEILPLVS